MKQNETKKQNLRLGCLISKEVSRFVYKAFLALNCLSICGNKDAFLRPGSGRL